MPTYLSFYTDAGGPLSAVLHDPRAIRRGDDKSEHCLPRYTHPPRTITRRTTSARYALCRNQVSVMYNWSVINDMHFVVLWFMKQLYILDMPVHVYTICVSSLDSFGE